MSYMTTMVNDEAEDSIWIRETIAGNREAFGHLIEKYKDSLLNLASRMLGNRAEAEDVLQDAFVEAYRHLAGFNHQSRFSTWMYSIVLNRVRNRIRHNKVLRWTSLDIRRATRDGYKPPQNPERGPAVDVLTGQKLEMEALRRELKFLSLPYQSIFSLRYFEDKPLKEVARELNKPLGTIKVYLHRARRLLYKRLNHVPSWASSN